MRAIGTLGLLLLLAGCAGDPRSLGITGPGPQDVPKPPVDDGNNYQAGAPQTGSGYSATYGGPTTGSTGFWGYNQ
jgi:hypothetical protein